MKKKFRIIKWVISDEAEVIVETKKEAFDLAFDMFNYGSGYTDCDARYEAIEINEED